jgi:hypothetical protein
MTNRTAKPIPTVFQLLTHDLTERITITSSSREKQFNNSDQFSAAACMITANMPMPLAGRILQAASAGCGVVLARSGDPAQQTEAEAILG